MKTIYEVPTGHIVTFTGEKGKGLEYLSIGDYGANQNVKADFLGLTEDILGVANQAVMPLEEKWVITISTQYGCSSNCLFCDVPKVGHGVNCTYNDLTDMITGGLSLHQEVEATKRLNIHFARMGEPTWNSNVLKVSSNLLKIVRPFVGRSLVHPVVSTMLPRKNKKLMNFLNAWTIDIKNDKFRGNAGLQFSINSTDDKQRNHMFSGNSLYLKDISEIGKNLISPKGRKYTLNFALADDYIIDAERLVKLFDPRKFMVKITPLHKTDSCDNNDIKTSGGYTEFTPYKQKEDELKSVGFDVLVFIPSMDEDESRITCGNALLSGTRPLTKYNVI